MCQNICLKPCKIIKLFIKTGLSFTYIHHVIIQKNIFHYKIIFKIYNDSKLFLTLVLNIKTKDEL